MVSLVFECPRPALQSLRDAYQHLFVHYVQHVGDPTMPNGSIGNMVLLVSLTLLMRAWKWSMELARSLGASI